MDNLNIRELIKTAVPPQEWFCDSNHPIFKTGWLEDGVCLKFHYDDERLKNVDDLLLWQLYAMMESYWEKFYEECYNKTWEAKKWFYPHEKREALEKERICPECGFHMDKGRDTSIEDTGRREI